MSRPPSRPQGRYTRAEIQANYRARRKAARRVFSSGEQIAEPVPEFGNTFGNTQPMGGTQVPPAPPDRVTFHPAHREIATTPAMRREEFSRFTARRDNLDLAGAVLRACAAHHGITSRDLAAACDAELLPVLKVLGFLDGQRLVYDADRDGQWHAVPNVLAEWQARLDQGRSYN